MVKKQAKKQPFKKRNIALLGTALMGLILLLFYRLGSLVPGLSVSEVSTLNTPVGIKALYENSLFLPLEVLRAGFFHSFSEYGAFLGRAPNALLGLLAIICFSYVIYKWHGKRTSLLITLMFATSAWTLHVSRLASYDVMYLVATPILLASYVLLQKYAENRLIFLTILLSWTILLYTPGLVWLVLLSIIWQRDAILDGLESFKGIFRQGVIGIVFGTLLMPLALTLAHSGQFKLWLGLPTQWLSALASLKQIIAVPVHLFIRGPVYPELWLENAVILDIFTTVMCIIGIYFYIRHLKAGRSKMLLSYGLLCWLLIGLGGAVSLSLLVPLLYVFVGAGMAYLLRDWLKTFPENPIARIAGVSLISLAVFLSIAYNVRAYFIAWPHNEITQQTFRYKR